MEKPISAAMLSIASTRLNEEEKKLLEQANPLGVSLFARNIKDKEQLRLLTREIRETIGREDVLIAVDQEGGRVRRLSEPEFRPYASQAALGSIADAELRETAVRDHAFLISADLQDTDINWNYAPCLDTAFDDTTPVLKNRCFGGNEKEIAACGKLMVEEYTANGICPCIKHMPGHGRATSDPHLGLPVLNHSLQELEKDFYPFRQLRHAPAGMTAHIMIPSVDSQNPITQSPKGIKEIIRGIIGFDGLLISDAIDMHALKGSLGERTRRSLEAGCDCVCYCFGETDGLREVIAHCGFMTDKSMIRFAKIKNIIKNKLQKKNIEKTAAEYQSIIGKIDEYNGGYDATEVLHKMMQANARR